MTRYQPEGMLIARSQTGHELMQTIAVEVGDINYAGDSTGDAPRRRGAFYWAVLTLYSLAGNFLPSLDSEGTTTVISSLVLMSMWFAVLVYHLFAKNIQNRLRSIPYLVITTIIGSSAWIFESRDIFLFGFLYTLAFAGLSLMSVYSDYFELHGIRLDESGAEVVCSHAPTFNSVTKTERARFAWSEILRSNITTMNGDGAESYVLEVVTARKILGQKNFEILVNDKEVGPLRDRLNQLRPD